MAKEPIRMPPLASVYDFIDAATPEPRHLFTGGVLRYERSGHPLTINGEWYVCALKQKQGCADEREKAFRVDLLERKMESVADAMRLDLEKSLRVYYDINRELTDMNVERGVRYYRAKELMDATLVIIKQEARTKKRINQRDVRTFKDAYATLLVQNQFNQFVDSILIALKCFSLRKTKREMVKYAAPYVRAIHVDDAGRVAAMSLEGGGCYLFQRIEKAAPGFIKNLGVEVRMPLVFPSLNAAEAVRRFEENRYRDAYSYDAFVSDYAEEKQVEMLFEHLRHAPEEVLIGALEQMTKIVTTPLAQFRIHLEYAGR